MKEPQAIEKARKAHLCKYIKNRGAIERLTDELARRKNRQFIPAMPDSDGSKRSPGASDRMGNAVISRISFEEKAQLQLLKYEAEMSRIEDAVLGLEDGLEQQVMLLRYITGASDGTNLMPWRNIAVEIYGNDDDAQLQAVFRIHGRALQHIDLEGEV